MARVMSKETDGPCRGATGPGSLFQRGSLEPPSRLPRGSLEAPSRLPRGSLEPPVSLHHREAHRPSRSVPAVPARAARWAGPWRPRIDSGAHRTGVAHGGEELESRADPCRLDQASWSQSREGGLEEDSEGPGPDAGPPSPTTAWPRDGRQGRPGRPKRPPPGLFRASKSRSGRVGPHGAAG
jgi:hypothetical protein